MLHQTSCGLLLLGLIVQVTLCGSSVVHPNCLKPPGGYRIQYKCPPGRHVHGQVCQMTCVEGYQLSESPASITCLEGLWKYSAAKCVHVESECPSPPRPPHGVYHCISKTHDIGAVCNLICDQGYQPESPKIITCQSSATWSTASACVPMCPVPSTISHGHVSCTFQGRHISTKYKVGSVCTASCKHGFTAVHPRYNCVSDIHGGAKWSGQPSCKVRLITEARCPQPPQPSHGVYHCLSATHKIHSVCSLVCDDGYIPKSSISITCQSSAIWSAPSSCVTSACPPPPKLLNGVYSCTARHGSQTHKMNDMCRLHCNQGYRPSTTHSDIKCLSTGEWSASSECHGRISTTCPAPPHTVKGRYHCKFTHGLTTHKVYDVCQLHCHEGYSPSSSHSDIQCLSTGRWSAPAACREIVCPAVQKVTHGWYFCPSSRGSHKLHEVCTLHCSKAYRPSTTDSDIRCPSTGLWSTPASCHEIKCPALPNVANGKYTCVSSTTHKLNDTCHLHCSTGYKPNNPGSNITCLYSEQWSTPNSCIEIKCPVPPKVLNGQYSCSSSLVHKLNDVCHLQCVSGYKPSTIHSDIKCTSSASWSTQASCQEIRCPSPPTVPNGQYICPSTSTHKLNDTCDLECSTGYKPKEKGSHISCLSSNEWSTSDSCIEIQCPAPPNVILGKYTCASSTTHTPNNVCHLQCSAGYKPNNPGSNITCLSSEKWSTPDSCTEKAYSQPPTVANGKYECSSHRVDHDCHLQCSAGYKPNNPGSNITCLSSEKWSSPDLCIEKTCLQPPTVANGRYECSSHRVNDECQLKCLFGYKPSRIDTNIKCLSTGKWSTSSATCNEIQCPTPATVSHGSFHCSSTVHKPGSMCSLTCDTGYTPSRANTEIVCSSSSTWSSSPTCDEIQCPTPATVSHGSFHCSSTVHKPGSTCSLTCDTGYTPSRANTEIVCSSSSTWSSSPTCDEKYCQAPPTVNHGSFHCSSTVHRPGSMCSLTCDTGYTPSRSDTAIVCSSSATWSSSARCDAVSTTIASTSTTSASTTTIVTSTIMTTESTTSTSTFTVSPTSTFTVSPTSTSTVSPTSTSTVSPTSTSTVSPTSTSTVLPTSTSTVSPTTVAPLGCEVCSGSLCGLIPGNDPVIQCPNKKPYCLNHVDNDNTGSKTVTKSCTDADECNRRWWHETSDKSNCVDFNPTNIYNYQLSCTYCCTKPGCNKDIVPARSTLFIGHD